MVPIYRRSRFWMLCVIVAAFPLSSCAKTDRGNLPEAQASRFCSAVEGFVDEAGDHPFRNSLPDAPVTIRSAEVSVAHYRSVVGSLTALLAASPAGLREDVTEVRRRAQLDADHVRDMINALDVGALAPIHATEMFGSQFRTASEHIREAAVANCKISMQPADSG
jgi:hypothetical protein